MQREILEREADSAVFEQALLEARSAGRLVLVSGEAGIGKTSLVTSVLGASRERRVLWGACDALTVPRSLGPVHDIARQAGGPIATAVSDGAAREPLLGALLDELGASRPTVIVIEDLHWADEATLDVLALLARRLPAARGCLVVTCRCDALAERDDVRRVLGSFPVAFLARIELAPLSGAAVETLARDAGRCPLELQAVTGGNPFFVAEALTSTDPVPPSVQAAVLLRVGALSPPSRVVVEMASVVPGRAELWLVAEAVDASAEAIDACLTSGILELRDDALGFRHQLARGAVEGSLGPLRRRELNATVLAALERRGGIEPARLAHHARGAGDDRATRRLAPVAAVHAGRSGAHRQALQHWEAALAAGDRSQPDLAALEGVAFEAYLCGCNERALEARRAILDAARATGDAARVGEATRWISRLLWLLGRGPDAAETADRAVAVLRGLATSRELAMALSNRSQLAMLADRAGDAIVLGEEAIDVARRLDDRATLAHALTNVGAARISGQMCEEGRAELEQAFAIAVEAGHPEHAARALANLAMATQRRDPGDRRIAADLERALAFAREHNLEGPLQYVMGALAQFLLLRGLWDDAEADARASLAGDVPRSGSGVGTALLVLGRLQARRGDPEARRTLDEACRIARATGGPRCMTAALAARAEHAWLCGGPQRIVEVIGREPRPLTAELAFWLWRASALDRPPPGTSGGYALSVAGAWRDAAVAWTRLGFHYEAADAACEGDTAAMLRALETFDRLGAVAASRRVRRLLRARGQRRVPRGPRPSSRAAPGGLTPRQLEVARLISTGATNAEIAERLVVSPKTAGHHVSAVLAKLGLASRRDVRTAAARLGLTASD